MEENVILVDDLMIIGEAEDSNFIATPIPSKEMTIEEVHKLIDGDLVWEKWKLNDYVSGREIEVFPEWKPFMEKIVWDYRRGGWNFFYYKHGDREYLSFSKRKEWPSKPYEPPKEIPKKEEVKN